MTTQSLRYVAAIIVALGFVTAGSSGCGDDDSPSEDGGVSGKGGSGGKGGAGGKGGTGGKSGAGASGKGGTGGKGGAGGSSSGDDGGAGDAIDSKAADLRINLNLKLGEHLIFAAKATDAALGGRMDEFTAYNEKLKTNGKDIGAMVKAAFDATAETAFNKVWEEHNQYFVDYTTGVATDDQAKKDQAVKDLTENYVPQFAALLNSATKIPVADLKNLTMAHVLTTKAIVDAQASKDWTVAYTNIRTAFAHMQMIGDPLAEAISANDQTKFPGDAKTKAIDFRVTLNQVLQEHLYLATFATGAALGGRTDEFTAADAALVKNGTDIGDAIGGLYGDDAKTTFNKIWADHNTWFVDYTKGVAADDAAMKTAAVNKLTMTYVPMFTDFLNGATGIAKSALTALIGDHVGTTKAVVDAQKAGNWEAATNADRTAGQHMQMLADPLAEAIVVSKPDSF
jgi:hypothetical protein